MSTPRILHMLSPGDNVSPFDVNMAADAGFDVIVPYSGVDVDRVGPLVQDAIFSRPPKRFNDTGAFIGGHDVNVAAAMLDGAKQAMVPPFEISVFADPNGAYTTAAALVAMIESHLIAKTGTGFDGRNIQIFGGGPVGLCTAVLVAKQGGKPLLVRLTEMSAAREGAAVQFCRRYEVDLPWAPATTDDEKAAIVESADVVVACAKAGIQILSKQVLESASTLVVAADVNAVPPAGIEGIAATDAGVGLDAPAGAVGIGALAIGNTKYKVQHGLLKQMLNSERRLILDFPEAYQLARDLV